MKKTPLRRPMQPSAALGEIIGHEPIARTQVMKRLWVYIKAKALQDAKDKRIIHLDEALLAVFGMPSFTMFEMPRLLSAHLTPAA